MSEYDIVLKELCDKVQELANLKAEYEEFKQDSQDYQTELEYEMQNKDKEIDDLKNKMDQLKKKLDAERAETNKLNIIIDREKEKNRQAYIQNEEMKKKLVELEQTIEELENERRNFTYERTDLAQNLEALEERHIIEMEDVWSQIGLKIEEIERLKQENLEMYDELQVIKSKRRKTIDDTSGLHNVCTEQIELHKTKITELIDQMSILDKEYQAKITILEQEIQCLKEISKKENKNDMVNNTQNKEDTTNSLVKILKHRNQELERELGLKSNEIEQRNKLIEMMKKDLDTLKNDITKFRNASNDNQSFIATTIHNIRSTYENIEISNSHMTNHKNVEKSTGSPDYFSTVETQNGMPGIKNYYDSMQSFDRPRIYSVPISLSPMMESKGNANHAQEEFITPKMTRNSIADSDAFHSTEKELHNSARVKKGKKYLIIKPEVKASGFVEVKKGSISVPINNTKKTFGFDGIYQHSDFDIISSYEDPTSILGKNMFFMVYGPKKSDKKIIKHKILDDFIKLFCSASQTDKLSSKQCKLKIRIDDNTLHQKSSNASRFDQEHEFAFDENGKKELEDFIKTYKSLSFQRSTTDTLDVKRKLCKKIFLDFITENESSKQLHEIQDHSSSDPNHTHVVIITSNIIHDYENFRGLISVTAILDYLINGNKSTALKRNNQDLDGIEKNFVLSINLNNLNDKVMVDTIALATKLDKCIGFNENPLHNYIPSLNKLKVDSLLSHSCSSPDKYLDSDIASKESKEILMDVLHWNNKMAYSQPGLQDSKTLSAIFKIFSSNHGFLTQRFESPSKLPSIIYEEEPLFRRSSLSIKTSR